MVITPILILPLLTVATPNYIKEKCFIYIYIVLGD